MAFNELIFPFVFLPLSLLSYALAPRKVRYAVLALISLIFFAWGDPAYILLMLCSLGMNYFGGLEIGTYREMGRKKEAKTALILSVSLDLLLLFFFKYRSFLLENINALFSADIPLPKADAPIGVSFYTFSLLSYLFDLYRGKAPMQKDPLRFSAYILFFPKLISGPIVPYHEFDRQIGKARPSWAKVGIGLKGFIIGLAKKMLLAETLGKTFYATAALPLADVSGLTAWTGALCYALMLYFDFSGYSDMAIGLARMFGFRFEKNFDLPYRSISVTDFWRRWHISLGAWFRDYVYIPLGGSRQGDAVTIRNLCAVWLLTGFWHGASWTFVFWGLYYALLLIVEKFVLGDLLKKIPNGIRTVLTVLIAVIGWVFFFSESLPAAFSWVGKMFGAGTGSDPCGWFYLKQSFLPLLIGAAGATGLGPVLGEAVLALPERLLGKNEARRAILCSVFYAVLLLLSIAAMTGGTYSTFLYFQF